MILEAHDSEHKFNFLFQRFSNNEEAIKEAEAVFAKAASVNMASMPKRQEFLEKWAAKSMKNIRKMMASQAPNMTMSVNIKEDRVRQALRETDYADYF